MIRALLIDDEEDAIKSLSIMINEFCADIDIVGTAGSALVAIKMINKLKPDLVFLDVEMPNGSGFEVLEGADFRDFQVVFTTAYEHYAIKAIKANAIDYLLKPIDIDELITATERLKAEIRERISIKKRNWEGVIQAEKCRRIPVSVKNTYVFLELEEIHFIKSDGSYSILHTPNKSYTTAKNLKYYEKLLSDCGFLRVSNSHLVNLDKIVKYIREDGGVLELQNNVRVLLSKSRKEELKRLLKI